MGGPGTWRRTAENRPNGVGRPESPPSRSSPSHHLCAIMDNAIVGVACLQGTLKTWNYGLNEQVVYKRGCRTKKNGDRN